MPVLSHQISKLLHKLPIHSFLVGIHFVVFLYVSNIHEVTPSMAYRSAILVVIISALVFGIIYLFSRSAIRSGIFTTLFFFGFFLYGFFYNEANSLVSTYNLPVRHVHRYLAGVYVIAYLLLLIFLFRSTRLFRRLNFFLNIFLACLFLYDLGLYFFKVQNGAQQHAVSKNIYLDSLLKPTSLAGRGDAKPDIYYIILDGFASENTLRKYYGFKEPELYAYLRKKGFYIADSSQANYAYTAASLSSSLNFHYINNTRNFSTWISQNAVGYIFKSLNYRVVNVESGYAVTEKINISDKAISINGINEFEGRMLEMTMLRLDDVLGFNNYNRLKSQLALLPTIANERGPKFTFIHIVAPHPPYVTDSVGNYRLFNSLSDMEWESKEGYSQQVKYLSRKVIEFMDTVLDRADDRIIILQSDHGPWMRSEKPEEIYEARMNILNAYYVPDSIHSKLYKGITPVNSFRILFAELFKLPYEKIPDHPFPMEKLRTHNSFTSHILSK